MLTLPTLISASLLTTGLQVEGRAEGPLVYESWRVCTKRDGLPHEDVRAIRIGGDRVWVATAGGLARCEAGTWTSWTEGEGLPWPSLTAVGVDARTGDVWLGSWGGGLIRFSGGRFDRFDQLNSGLAGNLVFDVAVTADRVWAATNGGLSSFDPIAGVWDLHFERRADGPETAIVALDFDATRLFAAAWCGGLWQAEAKPGSWSLVEGPASGASELETTMGLSAAPGALWWVTQDRLLRADAQGHWEMRRVPASGFIHGVVAIGDSVAAVGTETGLQILTDLPSDTWVEYQRRADARGQVTLRRGGRVVDVRITESAIPDNRIRCLAVRNDEIWVGTAAGLAVATSRSAFDAPPRSDVDVEPLGEPARSATSRPSPTEAEKQRFPVVNIGVLRPGNRTISVPGSRSPGIIPRLGQIDRLAVSLAVEQANDRGGFRGQIPFGWTTGPEGAFRGWGWTTPEDDLPILASRPDVLGIVGYLGPGSCFTTAVTLGTELPLVNAAPTPPTIDELINPYIFRSRGRPPRPDRLLLDYLFDRLGHTRLGLLRVTGQPGQTRLDRWADLAQARGHPVVADVTSDSHLPVALRALRRSGAEVVLTWCDAPTSAAILIGMREVGMTPLFVGSAQIVNEEFVSLVGPEAGGVIAVVSGKEEAAPRFVQDYRARFKRAPPPGAQSVFEAVNHLLAAIEIAGLDRRAVRDTLQSMDRTLGGERIPPADVVMHRLEDGSWRRLTVSDREIQR